jgi:hypothetical protein
MEDHDAEFVRKLVRSRSKVEARKWLSGHNASHQRGISEMSYDDSAALVAQLYEWGAVEVFVADFKVNEPYEGASILLIKLPTNSDSRTQIFDWISHHSQQEGFDPVEYDGQEYEAAWFD